MTFEPKFSLPSKRQWALFTMSTEANGLSSVLDLGGGTMAALQMPATWTAASLSFTASVDNSTYYSVYGSTGDEIVYTVDASRMVTFDPAFWLGFQYIKLRSGTFATPVEQASPRTFYVGIQALGVLR